MIEQILTSHIYQLISTNFDIQHIYEVRLNVGGYIRINYMSVWHEISYEVTSDDIDEIVYNLTKGSMYSHLEELKKGYISYDNGVRVGVSGEVVYDDGKIIFIKNISSLILRLPHYIDDVDEQIVKFLYKDGRLQNTIILAPPFCGKTTKLRQLAYFLSKKHNIVIIDEKYELTTFMENDVRLINTTNILGVSRCQGIEMALRNLSPELIVTDEIYGEEDHRAISRAISSGVCVLTSAHSVDEYDYQEFDVRVFLKKNPIGAIEKITLRKQNV